MPRILVVDDDRAIQSMLTDLLTEQGYEVATARTGREALHQVDGTHAPDLLILDVLIPQINGFALVEQIREREALRKLPIILMSGIYRARNHRSEMTAFRVLDYLDKPLKNQQLLALITAAVGPGATPKQDQELESIEDVIEVEPDPAQRATVSYEPGVEELWIEPSAEIEKREVEREARSDFKQSAFLFQGSIKKTPVAEVVGELSSRRKSGALLLRRDRIKKILYLKHGTPYHVKSNLVSECLGRLLVTERLITPEQCETSIREMKKTGRRQGELLVEMNSISPKNLAFALELQMETKLFEPFAWTAGEYRFSPTSKLPDLLQAIEFTGSAFVVEGIRRTYDETRLRGQMLPVLAVPLRWAATQPDLETLKLTRRELAAARRIENGMTTEEMLSSLRVPPPDALRIVYSLIALRVLEPAG